MPHARKGFSEDWLALSPFSARYQHLPAFASLLMTYVFMSALMGICAKVLGADLKKFLVGFTLIFWISFGCWLLGNNAYIAATTQPEMKKVGNGWGMKVGRDAG